MAASSYAFGRGNLRGGRGNRGASSSNDFGDAVKQDSSDWGTPPTTSAPGFGQTGRGGSIPAAGNVPLGRGGSFNAPIASGLGRGGGASFGRGTAMDTGEPSASFGGGSNPTGSSAFGNGSGPTAGSGFGRGGAPRGRGFSAQNEGGSAAGFGSNFGRGGGPAGATFGTSNSGQPPTSNEPSANAGHQGPAGDGPFKMPSSFVPEIREVDVLFQEDEANAQTYRAIADEDAEVTVSGSNIKENVVLGSWQDAGFDVKLLSNVVDRAKYIRPRKIQAMAIPLIMSGRDIKGHAETGSGKTAAFMLPIIHGIMKIDQTGTSAFDKPAPYAIIIEPTRELCLQVHEQGRKFANGTTVTVAKAYGQYNMSTNMSELRTGCNILCATPGRLIHLVKSDLILLEKVQFLVLDEADHLLDGNFLEELREFLTDPKLPKRENRQTLLFSATFPELVQKIAKEVLRDDNVMVSNKNLVSTNSKVAQRFVLASKENRKQLLLEIIQKDLEQAQGGIRRIIVFVRTKRDTDLISLFLSGNQVKATTLHGDRTQGVREKALRDFRNGEACVLVTTDVCARGIDIKDLEHVINFDLPGDSVTYVHRIGRTGRIKPGMATSFFDEYDENDCTIAKDLLRFLNDVNQEAPEFLKKAAEGGGFPSSKIEPMEVTASNDAW